MNKILILGSNGTWNEFLIIKNEMSSTDIDYFGDCNLFKKTRKA